MLKNDDSTVTGVKCFVRHCYFHDNASDHCTASVINIKGESACCCGETLCDTFKMK